MLSTDAPRRNVPVALVYQSEALNAHVREAMTELGAKVVYESSVLAYRPADLSQSGAEVVIVNLDPASDDDLGAIDELLIDDQRRVVFNDGDVTARLSGWDLARWARHLAAKVLGQAVGLPPKPEGAESIPQVSPPRAAELSTPTRPKDMEPTTQAGTQAENDQVADEMTRALAGFSMAQAEVSEQAAAHDDLASSLASLGFGDLPDASAAPVAETPAAPAERITEAKSIFDELGLGLDLGAPTPAKAAPPVPEATEDNPFAGLDINFDSFDAAPPARDEPEGLDALLASLPKETKPEAAVPPRTDRSTAPTLELPAIPPVSAAPKAREDNPFAGLSLELAPLDGDVAAAPAPVAESRPASAPARDFSDVLASLSLTPLDDGAPAPAPTPAPAAAAAAPTPAPVEDNPFAGLSLSLEPLGGEEAAPAAAPAARPQAGPPPIDEDNPFADFDLSLDLASSSGDGGAIKAVEKESMADAPSEDDFMREFAALGALDARPAGDIGHVVILGASIGGPDAVREFLGGVDAGSGSVFVLAQHMGADFVELMAQQLQRATRLNVVMPKSGDAAKAGDVLIVPVSERLLLESEGVVRLMVPDQASPYSPSIDQVLFDFADRFGDKVMAIIFSGMAHDAIEGAKYLAAKGGKVWVQDPATCVVSSMIDGAMEAGVVSFIGSPSDLAAQFNREFK